MEQNVLQNSDASKDWEQHQGVRTTESLDADTQTRILPTPTGLVAESGAGQVTLRWQPVPGAVGYLVHRSDTSEGPFVPIDHGGRDVLAVPGPSYADTTGTPGTTYWYAITALADPRYPTSPLSMAIEGTMLNTTAPPVRVTVKTQEAVGKLRQVWHMLGSEHLSQLFYTEGPGGSHIGEEFAIALQMVRRDLGTTHVRAHAIFHDENTVYREVDGQISYDFSAIDRIYDRLIELQLRPIVELSFVPHDLARNPGPSVFTYRALISPPKDWVQWAQLCRQFVAHLIERYGIDEVAQWGFEVWNEPNLQVFWTGTQEEYFHLYDVTARAIKAIDERLRVGGPATAAAEWIADFLQYMRAHKTPLDFISTHTYGNLPLDFTQALNTYGFTDIKIWWTEWGVTPLHFALVNDTAFSAVFTLHGMKSVQGRVDALTYWVLSDHFEELGHAPRLLHGGFGLLTIGNLRKPRYWALALAQALGTDLVHLNLQGDGANSLIDGWATRKPDGSIDLLLWNGTLDQSRQEGYELLKRQLDIHFEQLANHPYLVSIARVDIEHSNIASYWNRENHDDAWPTAEQWEMLRTADKLDETTLPPIVPIEGNTHLALDLPMPGIIRIRLIPQKRTA
jgi:xylan 1,4-beta-xylosidase